MHPVTSGSAHGRWAELGAGLPAGRLLAHLATHSLKPANFGLTPWGNWHPGLPVVVRSWSPIPTLGSLGES